ncbi:MAG TPA: prephenate dehydrogenase/arogenate dehydrogenase family protein [Thermomicrobiales bacterium]|nr:prephenate dehydrogenase/arogenate dehydrogenase family protein [Thermomicrobiales bacterium]
MAQNVTIIGLGLIGGSIGLALKRWSRENSNALRITGFDEQISQQNKAKKMGAIDGTEWTLGKAVSDADVVIVATPVQTMREVFSDIAEFLKPGAIVTDTGSTKADVLEWAKELPSTVSFVGGHPMAGKSEGLDGADADLFRGATWVICPSVSASEDAIRNVLGIVAATGADSYFVDPTEHDSYVAAVSHLPFVTAISLVNAVTSDPAWRDMRNLASTGLKDSTRLALGSPEMHRDIAMTNRDAIVLWIDRLTGELQTVRRELVANDENLADTLFKRFEQAQDARARLEVPVSRSDEAMTESQRSVSDEGVGEQMQRMFFGGFRRRGREGEKSNGKR